MTDRFTPSPGRQVQLRPLDGRLAGRRRLRWRRPPPAGPGRDGAPARRARRGRGHLPRRRPAARRGDPGARARPLPEGPGRDRHGRRDGDDEPVQPRGVQGRRADRQRPRRPPVRPRQGAAQHRPGRRAGREDLRAVGRPRGRGVRRQQGRRRRAGPVQGGDGHALRLRARAGLRHPLRPRAQAERAARRHPAAHHRPRARVHRRARGARRASASTPRSGTRRWPG